MTNPAILSIEAMGGDDAPRIVIEGLDLFVQQGGKLKALLHGDEAELRPLIADHARAAGVSEIRHTEKYVAMDAKPSSAVRGGRGSSMWNALQSVKAGEAHAAVSAGNTGALMAMAKLVLRTVEGVHRPAIAASWPGPETPTVVLDVGANVDADADQLIEFAIMGEAYSRAIHGKDKPLVGLLNIGSEELKGHDEIRLAAKLIRESGVDINYHGFVEGNDISLGTVDVVVTDGFTGNVALKTAEGTARLVGQFIKEALTSGPMSMAGAALARGGLKKLKERMDPREVNGGVFLGLNGMVVKSHGGADARGFATALRIASDLATSKFTEDVQRNLQTLRDMRERATDTTDEEAS